VSNEELIAKTLDFMRERPGLADSAQDLFLELLEALEAQPAPLVADSRDALVEFFKAQGLAGPNVLTSELLDSGIVSLAADRDRAEDPYCRAEDCQYRNWTSGSIPTHKRGSTCPNPYRESEGRND